MQSKDWGKEVSELGEMNPHSTLREVYPTYVGSVN